MRSRTSQNYWNTLKSLIAWFRVGQILKHWDQFRRLQNYSTANLQIMLLTRDGTVKTSCKILQLSTFGCNPEHAPGTLLSDSSVSAAQDTCENVEIDFGGWKSPKLQKFTDYFAVCSKVRCLPLIEWYRCTLDTPKIIFTMIFGKDECFQTHFQVISRGVNIMCQFEWHQFTCKISILPSIVLTI